MKDDASSEKQRLDEAKLATQTYKGAVAVTQSYLLDGYSISDLKSLREGLHAVQVKGKPTVSLKRFITGLQAMKTLDRIKDEIDKKTSELAVLKSETSKAQGILDGYQQHLLSTLKKTNQDLTDTLAKTNQNLINTFAKTNQDFIDTSANTNKKALGTLQTWEKGVEKTFDKIGKTYAEHICKLDENVKASFGNAEKSLDAQMGLMKVQIQDMTKEILVMDGVAAGITATLDKKTVAAIAHLRRELKSLTDKFNVT